MDATAAMLQRVGAALRPLTIVPAATAVGVERSSSGQLLAADEAVPSPAEQVPGADEKALTADQQKYLEFYRINFESEFSGLRHSLGYINSGNQRLAVHVLRQSQARRVLLLVHGYLDHVGLFRHLIRYGLQRGYTVVAFDLPGHGLSSGDRVAIDDFSDYRRAIESVLAGCRNLPTQWRVIAQSTGGAAVLDYLLHHKQLSEQAFEKVVLLAPLVRPRGWFWVVPAHVLLHRFRDSVERKFAENSNDQEYLDWLRTDPLQSDVLSVRWIGALRRWLKTLPANQASTRVPLLLIQGDADGTVDWRYNVKRIKQLIATTRVEFLAGGRHHLANESLPIRQRIYALIDEFFA